MFKGYVLPINNLLKYIFDSNKLFFLTLNIFNIVSVLKVLTDSFLLNEII